MIENLELLRILSMLKSCGPLFIALGDEQRQKLIIDIADAGTDGINVTNLSQKSNLSRPAISHHLRVLKDCGVIKPLKIGTQIFYQLNLNKNLETLSELIHSMQNVISKIRKETNDLELAK